MKTCSKCGEEKPLSQFDKNKALRDGHTAWCSRCLRAYRRGQSWKLKLEIIDAYGGECVCCGETDPKFLTIDHVDGDGRQHRSELGQGTSKLYPQIKREGFPSRFRLLCWNCNSAMGLYGECPHRQSGEPVIVGLDTAGNRLHGVVLDIAGETVLRRFSCEPLKGKKWSNPDVRRHQLAMRAQQEFRLLPVGSVIFAEEPLSLQNGKTTRVLGLAAGAIWAAHLSLDLTWMWVDVSTWKKAMIGHGGATKDEVRLWSLLHGGTEDWEEDHYDAHAVGAYGAMRLAAVVPED